MGTASSYSSHSSSVGSGHTKIATTAMKALMHLAVDVNKRAEGIDGRGLR